MDISSATQGISGDNDMDIEQEVMSPQLHDHPYYAPHQTTDAGLYQTLDRDMIRETQVSEASTQDLLGSVKIEPGSHPHPASESNTQNQEQPSDYSNDSYDGKHENILSQGPTDNNTNFFLLGYISSIPIVDVPYNVTHEDIAKALAVNSDAKVSVRIMRRVIPCIRIISYMKDAEFVGKKKIKGLWAKKPSDWGENVPYKDPNNGEKQGNGTTIPKANSDELRAMFVFLKYKLLQKFTSYFKELNSDERIMLKAKGTSYDSSSPYASYQFNTSAAAVNSGNVVGGKMVSKQSNKRHPIPPYSSPQVKVVSYQKQQRPVQGNQLLMVKQEMISSPKMMGYYTPGASSSPSIPTFVASEEWSETSPTRNGVSPNLEQPNSSPETSLDPSEDQTAYMQETAEHSDSSESGSSQCAVNYVSYVDDNTGEHYLIQLPPGGEDALSTSSSDSSNNNSLHETEAVQMQEFQEVGMATVVAQTNGIVTEKTVEKDVMVIAPTTGEKQQEVVTVSQPVPVTEKMPAPSTESVVAVKKSESISRGPIQQASSPENVNVSREKNRDVSHMHSGPKMEPPSPQPCSMMLSNTSPLLHACQMPLSQMPLTGPMITSDHDYNRMQIMKEIHSRLKSKVMSLQEMLLGEMDIAMGLNKVYKNVVQFQYQRALVGHQNDFVSAAHSCEAVLDKALMDGNNYPREKFLQEIDSVIEKYSVVLGDGPVQKTTVFHVSNPDNPPIQAEQYAKLQREGVDCNPLSPVAMNPKSPGTALTEKMQKMDLSRGLSQLMTKQDDPQQLGIKPRKDGEDVLRLLEENNIIEASRHVPQVDMENDDNFLPLPEKLAAMGVDDVDVNTFHPDVMNDFLKQLLEQKTDKNDVIDLTSDDYAVDIKKQKTNHDFSAPTATTKTLHPEKQQMDSQFNESKPAPGMFSTYDTQECQDGQNKEDLESVIDDILSLENSYDYYEINWSGNTSNDKNVTATDQSTEKRIQQPATPDDGIMCFDTTGFQQQADHHEEYKKCTSVQAKPGPVKAKPVSIQPRVVPVKPKAVHFQKPISARFTPQHSQPNLAISLPGTNLYTSAGCAQQVHFLPVYTSMPTAIAEEEEMWMNAESCEEYPSVSTIPEVVENFGEFEERITEDKVARRQKGRKRIHTDN